MELDKKSVAVSLKRPVNVALVSTYSNKHGGVVSESLGPEALAGDLIGEFGRSIKVTHDDLQLDGIDKIISNIKNIGAGIVGVSVKIGALNQLNETMQALTAIESSPLVVLGGVVPTFASEELLQIYPNALMAIGESELTMRGLVRYVQGRQNLDSVPGIRRLVDGEIRTTPSARIDLEKIHPPARLTTKRVHDELGGLVWFEGSRGCDWHCTFCSRRSLRGDGFSGGMSIKHVVDDLENLYKMGIKTMHATDDDWGGDPERTLQIAEEIIARKLDIKWSVSTRADHIWKEAGRRDNPEEVNLYNQRLEYILRRQVEAGLDRVFLGIESFSPSQLKRYGKQISVQANYRAVEVLRKIGVDVVAGYIPIDPLMTIEELNENLIGLRSTGMYKKVTNPLSVLRVQEGSPYLRMVRSREKVDGEKYLKEKSEDLIFYDIDNYADPRIKVLAELADQWVSDMYPFIFGLKMEVFSSTQNSRIDDHRARWCEQKLHDFRELEMSFIEDLTNAMMTNSRGKDINHIVNNYKKIRQEKLNNTINEMGELKIEIRNFDIPGILNVT